MAVTNHLLFSEIFFQKLRRETSDLDNLRVTLSTICDTWRYYLPPPEGHTGPAWAPEERLDATDVSQVRTYVDEIERLKDLSEQLMCDYIDGLSNFLPDTLIMSAQPRLPIFEAVPILFIKLFRDCFAAIRRDLSEQVYYLNSFRKSPARIYTTGQTAGDTLAPNGSNFAEVLWRLRDEAVRFVHPDVVETATLAEMTAAIVRDVLHMRQTVRVVQKGG